MIKNLGTLLVLYFSLHLSVFCNDVDSMHHYLIFQSKSTQKYSIVLSENKKMEVHNRQGNYYQGRLLIINDSTVAIFNKFSAKSDTILISDITKIRYVGLANKIIACPSMLLGAGFLMSGGVIFTAAGNYDPIGTAIGISLMIISTPFIVLSSVLFYGKNYKTSEYDVLVHHSTIKKLKRKQAKHFYPST